MKMSRFMVCASVNNYFLMLVVDTQSLPTSKSEPMFGIDIRDYVTGIVNCSCEQYTAIHFMMVHSMKPWTEAASWGHTWAYKCLIATMRQRNWSYMMKEYRRQDFVWSAAACDSVLEDKLAVHCFLRLCPYFLHRTLWKTFSTLSWEYLLQTDAQE